MALLWKSRSSLAARFQLPNLRHPIAFQPAHSFITGHRRRRKAVILHLRARPGDVEGSGKSGLRCLRGRGSQSIACAGGGLVLVLLPAEAQKPPRAPVKNELKDDRAAALCGWE